MAISQIQIDDTLENGAIPLSVQHRPLPDPLQEAVRDSRTRKNLIGPFDNAADAVVSMLEDAHTNSPD